jgi:hypothetical protein
MLLMPNDKPNARTETGLFEATPILSNCSSEKNF